jgi:hypothetical protein
MSMSKRTIIGDIGHSELASKQHVIDHLSHIGVRYLIGTVRLPCEAHSVCDVFLSTRTTRQFCAYVREFNVQFEGSLRRYCL